MREGYIQPLKMCKTKRSEMSRDIQQYIVNNNMLLKNVKNNVVNSHFQSKIFPWHTFRD